MISEIIIKGKLIGTDINYNDFINDFNKFLESKEIQLEGILSYNEYTEVEIIE